MRRLATLIWLAATLVTGAVRADSVGDVHTGNAAFGDGRYEAAVEAFTRAILAGDLPPEALAIAFNNRGVAYSELGDFDRAIGDCNQALALSPGDATAIRNLRIAYQRRAAAAARQGDRTAAQTDYGQAIQLDPKQPLPYLRRGQLALESGDRAAAIADLTIARDLDPTNADILRLLADAERMQATGGIEAQAAAPVPQPAPAAEANLEPPAEAIQPPAPDPDYSIDPPGGQPAPQAQAQPNAALAPGAGPVAAAASGAGRAHRALQDVNVRQGPGNDYPRIGSLAQGSTVLVVSERLGWLEVRLSGGGSGYVYRKWLQDLGTAGTSAP